MKKKIKVLILAAGKGTRMRSDKPKVLHKLSGKSMLVHIIDNCILAGIKDINIVLGEKKDLIERSISKKNINIIYQRKQLGTADAIKAAKNTFKGFKGNILILYGDMPLIRKETIRKIINQTKTICFSLVSFMTDDPSGYGRVVIKKNNIEVIEDKNADYETKKIKTCYSGVLCGPSTLLFSALNKIKKDINSNEYLFTDIFKKINSMEIAIKNLQFSELELMGINDKIQLNKAESILQNRIKDMHIKNGVTILMPDTVYISCDVKIGKNVTIEPNVFLGQGVNIKANVLIKSNSHVEDTLISSNCQIGPLCRIRNNTKISNNVKIGNFVEIKNSFIGSYTKINHLAYIGDSEIGKNTNIGAGCITCNYDGVKKNKTIIGDNVFIGSNCSLIAPIKIDSNSFVAAGSAISNNIGKNDFSIARSKQQIIKNGRRKFLKVK